MTTTQRRTLAALLLGATVLSLILLPPTLFVIGAVVVIVVTLLGVAVHWFEQATQLAADNIHLGGDLQHMTSLYKGTFAALGDCLEAIDALRAEHALCPAPVAQVVQLRPAPGTRGASS